MTEVEAVAAKKGRLLLVNVEPKDKAGETYRIIREAGIELVLGRDSWDHAKEEYGEAELVELCREADGLIVGSREAVTRRLIESCPRLRVVSKHGTGVDRIDMQAATERGVLVTNTPVHSPVVAEHTVALMLGLLKRLCEMDRRVRQGGWRAEDLQSSLVRGKTVGIVGFGRIGSEIAKRLQGWEVKMLAFDPYAQPELLERYGVQRCERLEEMAALADVLSLNAVLTEETRGLVGEAVLGRMKKSAVLINTSRGEILDEAALVRALKEKRIAGAAMDVLEQEPPDPANELLRMDNVILTPHMSSLVPEIARLLRFTAMENALAALRGEVPKFVKNPEAVGRWNERFAGGRPQ